MITYFTHIHRTLKLFFFLFVLILVSADLHTQVIVNGVISDKSGEALPGISIKVLGRDSGFIKGVFSDMEGKFSVSLAPDKNYILVFSFLSYRSKYKNVEVKKAAIDLGKIDLKEEAHTLTEVEIKTVQQRGEQKGDTTAFNANAFKTNPDATAEDLLKKLPGVTSDNNGVKVNGETVQKVLVDGKPFFGDDPNAALKNLPAEIVDKVEVFDKMSDQAQFTGFNDGDQQKTINIVTKKGKNAGQFGKIYGGFGADEAGTVRYNGGAALNSFKDKRRITLLALSNNINQQNFSISDITSAMGNTGQSSGRGSGGPGGGYNSSSSLLTAPQNGNTATQSAGLNYSDAWGKKINVSGSYFFNHTDNTNMSNVTLTYFTEDNLLYKEISTSKKLNDNHRFNFRFEYTIDSSDKITIVPNLTFQRNDAGSTMNGSTSHLDDIRLNNAETKSKSLNLGYDFSNSILYQHKFKKNGRTISLNLGTSLSERDNEGSYYSRYSDTAETIRDQKYFTYGYTKKASANLSYTEPLNKYAQIQLSYNPSYTSGKSDKTTYDFDSFESAYNDFNPALTNKYNTIYQTQRGGLSYKYRKNKLNLSFGADVQESTLNGEQTFPVMVSLNQSFQNILPNAMMNYRFSKTKNLRIFYRTSTNIPSISQLQNVLDISNPLQVKSGNDRLKQTFENSLNIRFGGFNPTTSRNAMIFVNANYTDNYISNATYILKSDSVIQGSILSAGSQLSKPVNVDGFYNVRAFGVYGFPLKLLKSNFNINGGINYNHTPTLINDLINYSNSYATNGGMFLGSNISQNIDFSIGYTGNYTIVKNSAQTRSDNSYFTHTATLKLNYLLKRFVLNTDISHTLYNGLSQSFNQEYLLWNGYIGYKFLKDRSLEAKISLFDILNQNRSISRTVTGAYTEDNYTTVLRRYAMFTLTYTLKNFKNGTPSKTEERNHPFPGGPPPGAPPPPGGG